MPPSSTTPPTDVLPWGVTPEGELTSAAVAVGSVLGTLAVFTCLPLGVLAIVVNCKGLDLVKTDPAAARSLVSTSWSLMASAPMATVSVLTLVMI